MGRAGWAECRFGFQQCFDDLTEVHHAKLLCTQSYFGA